MAELELRCPLGRGLRGSAPNCMDAGRSAEPKMENPRPFPTGVSMIRGDDAAIFIYSTNQFFGY